MGGLPDCYRCGRQPCECKDGITLYCADNRDILPLLEEGSVDLVFTDPPYGHTENGSLQQRREAVFGWQDGENVYRHSNHHSALITNDGIEANELVQWLFSQAARLLRPGCCCCCCCGGGGGPDPQFARWSLWLDKSIPFKQMVVWDKGPMGMGWHYRRSYETVLVAQQPGAACKWFGGRATENIIRPGDYGIRKIIPSATQHPTEKPPRLAEHFVNIHSERGDLVLDPFAGSGTTGRACKDLGRRCIMVEIEEKYCRIAAERLAQGVLFTLC